MTCISSSWSVMIESITTIFLYTGRPPTPTGTSSALDTLFRYLRLLFGAQGKLADPRSFTWWCSPVNSPCRGFPNDSLSSTTIGIPLVVIMASSGQVLGSWYAQARPVFPPTGGCFPARVGWLFNVPFISLCGRVCGFFLTRWAVRGPTTNGCYGRI